MCLRIKFSYYENKLITSILQVKSPWDLEKEKPEIEANIYCALTARQYAKFFTYSISFSPLMALGLLKKKK